MLFECPHCNDLVELEDEQLGSSACPTCGEELPITSAHSEATTREQPRELGKFRLLQRVGAGAFGAVWKALDLELGRIVAVKMLHPTLLAGKAESERFYREARAAAQLRGCPSSFQLKSEVFDRPTPISAKLQGANPQRLS